MHTLPDCTLRPTAAEGYLEISRSKGQTPHTEIKESSAARSLVTWSDQTRLLLAERGLLKFYIWAKCNHVLCSRYKSVFSSVAVMEYRGFLVSSIPVRVCIHLNNERKTLVFLDIISCCVGGVCVLVRERIIRNTTPSSCREMAIWEHE